MTVLVSKTYEEIQVGDTATLERALTEKELVLFAAVSGDVNPVHLDAEFAKTTMFGEQIAHGMWSGSLISAALATVLPGPGTIYLGQELSFRRPVKLADTLTVTLTVKEKLSKNRVVIDTLVTNQNDEKVVVGTATVMAPTEKSELQAPELPAITIG
ncbi:MaoC/PaaZ C-terminal domain-containing protein [Oceanospirillum linum]|uniref:3-hydroxybutyryl-CoA dehydratase n=1 Tax=Oceanospirillum linum TaxID=966 RepID=A0A1T1H991_OCELI|nr:MaoC/PaaZ C-terminal domain-containing protein [Oceanospirillum linum]OOV86290.1 3-hydroxybutyryl-CoA dehydratase [Oceanospirillum linum]SEG46894.1 Acyl dehydratase [Oleiphilus messinensis]SMP30811.1 Acyl dehydratase [Oceanospirillum linum]